MVTFTQKETKFIYIICKILDAELKEEYAPELGEHIEQLTKLKLIKDDVLTKTGRKSFDSIINKLEKSIITK